jgi:hypothetical protein
MIITINLWELLPGAIAVFCVGCGIYERGQRKAWEAAEKLYSPLLGKIAGLTNSSLDSEPIKGEMK